MEFSTHRQVLCVEGEQDSMKHTEERESMKAAHLQTLYRKESKEIEIKVGLPRRMNK